MYQVSAPFAGPVRLGAELSSNPAGFMSVLVGLALGSLGVGAAVAARRKLEALGRLECASDLPVVGVPLDYYGDWWSERGRKLYRVASQTIPPEEEDWSVAVAVRMIALDLGADSACLSQFPPHPGTHPRNHIFWDALRSHVENERLHPGTIPPEAQVERGRSARFDASA